MILAMTAAEFQTLAIAWLGVVSTLAGVAIPIYFKIKAQIEENQKRIDKHDDLQKVCTKTPETPKQ